MRALKWALHGDTHNIVIKIHRQVYMLIVALRWLRDLHDCVNGEILARSEYWEVTERYTHTFILLDIYVMLQRKSFNRNRISNIAKRAKEWNYLEGFICYKRQYCLSYWIGILNINIPSLYRRIWREAFERAFSMVITTELAEMITRTHAHTHAHY